MKRKGNGTGCRGKKGQRKEEGKMGNTEKGIERGRQKNKVDAQELRGTAAEGRVGYADLIALGGAYAVRVTGGPDIFVKIGDLETPRQDWQPKTTRHKSWCVEVPHQDWCLSKPRQHRCSKSVLKLPRQDR